ncbi:MAG TPA: TlpA disulfide reductase family protein [Pyrinomonadaceae bacterium]|nr:TlpA disulfide reductase family protein [Pyrinomonadaceae bacterium]
MFMKRALVLAALIAAGSAASAQTATQTQTPTQTPSQPQPTPTPSYFVAGHEYAPLSEKTVNYKDWTFKNLKDGADVNLRQWAKGKKLVMVVYFAPWCGNWKLEAPVVARLHEKYAKQGFDVVAVSEYASADDARKYFESAGGVPYTVVVESEAREARDRTTHYNYRQACGDSRRWGSPFNVFLEPKKLKKDGEVVAEKAWVVGGELIEEEVEQFIRERLGLKDEKKAEKSGL